jgi:LysR family transcriptional regulator, transcriptional activator of the cysJI operon
MNCFDCYDSDLQCLPMDIRGLEVFLSVATHLNYTRAGEHVNLSQPSVSIRIRQLENELGVKLFDQLGKKVALTEAGLLLIPHAQRVIMAVADAQDAIGELQGLERGSLRIGTSTTPGMYLIPRTIAEFKQEYPKIDVHFAVKDTREIEEGVVRNEFDFGFVGGHLTGDEIQVLPWITDELRLIVAVGHHLASKKTVKPRDLSAEQFILRERGSASRAVVAGHLGKLQIEPKTVMEIENPESIKKAVQSGLGIAFISGFAIETELKAKTLVAIEIRNLKIRRELKIVFRKDKHLSHSAQAFIGMARK